MDTQSRRRKTTPPPDALAQLISTAAPTPLRDVVETRVPQPTYGEIAQRAHQLYEARGYECGRDLDDWLQAERELLTKPDS